MAANSSDVIDFQTVAKVLDLLTSCSLLNFVGAFFIPWFYDRLQEHIQFYNNRVPISISVVKFQSCGRYDENILLNESVPYPRSPLRDYSPKYIENACTVQTIVANRVQDDNGVFPNFTRILKGTVMAKEEPTYIILYYDKSRDNLRKDTSFLKAISKNYQVDLTATFLIMCRNDIFLQCAHCFLDRKDIMANSALIQLPENIRTFSYLHQQWYWIHKNLNGVYIHHKHSKKRWNSETCSFYYNSFHNTVPADCSYLIASNHLNFSTVNPWRMPTYGRVKAYQMKESQNGPEEDDQDEDADDFIHLKFFDRSKFFFRNEWLIVPTQYETFSHVLYLPKRNPNADFIILFRPFGISIWAAWVIAFMLTVIVLSFASTLNLGQLNLNAVFSILKRVGKRFLWVLSVVFQQSDNETTSVYLDKSEKKYNSVLLILASWLFTSIVLSNFYTGSLFSLITTDPPPNNIPASVRAMLASHIFIGTTNYYFIKINESQKEGVRYSIFKDLVLAPMIDADDGTNPYYKTLWKATYFFNVTNKVELIKKMSENLPVNTDQGPQLIPEMFALLSSESDIKIFTDLIHRNTGYVAVKAQGSIGDTAFISRNPWIGQRNFFLPLFKSILGQLVESGLYDRWKSMWRNAYYYRELSRFKAYSQNQTRSQNITFKMNESHLSSGVRKLISNPAPQPNVESENLVAYLFADRKSGKATDMLLKPEPLSTTSMQIVFLFAFLLDSLCFVVWIIEILSCCRCNATMGSDWSLLSYREVFIMIIPTKKRNFKTRQETKFIRVMPPE